MGRTTVLSLTPALLGDVADHFDLDEQAFVALQAGASGFLLKDARAEEVLTAIRYRRS